LKHKNVEVIENQRDENVFLFML